MSSSRPGRRTYPVSPVSRNRRHSARSKVVRHKPDMERLEGRTLLATDVWTGAVNANWSNAGNWSLGQIPGATDTAEFQNGRAAATVDNSFTIGALEIESSWGGTLSVNNSLLVSGNLTLASGTLIVGAPMSIGGPASSWTAGGIDLVPGQTLTNNGTFTIDPGSGGLTISGGGTLSSAATIDQAGTGSLALTGGTTINNESGATYDFQAPGSLSAFGNGSFTNAGTFTYGGAGTLTISTSFVNQGGTIDVEIGTLSIKSTNVAWTGGGTLDAATGATLQLAPAAGGDNGIRLTGTYTGSGGGAVELTAGGLEIGSSGATFDFPQGLFQWQGGSINVDLGGTLSNTGFLTLNNTSAITLSTIAPGDMINTGEVDQTGAGNLSLFSGTFDNQAGATYDVSGTGGVTGAGTFSDEGTIKMTGSGTATLSVFSALNGGTIDVASGTLSIASVDSHWTGGGTLDAATGATLQLAPAAGGDNGIQLTGTYTGSGGGAVELTAGGLEIGSSGATFDFPKGMFQWQAGSITLDLGGTLTNTGFLTLNNSGAITLSTIAPGDMINTGEVDQTGAGNLSLFSGTFDNQAGATYDISGTGGVTGAGTFSDEGTIKMTGSGTATLSVFSALNGGTIDVASGTLSIASVDSHWTGGGTLDAATGATLQLAPAAGGDNGIQLTGTYTGSGGGAVELTAGGLEIGSSGATFDFPKGMFQWQAGSITLDLGGTLSNTGFLTLNNSGAITLSTIAPGDMINTGEVDQTGAGNLSLFSGTFDNQAGATYDISGTGGVTGGVGSAGTFSDEGTIKMAGSGTVTLSVPCDLNGGTIDVASGTLATAGTGSTWTGGTLDAAAGATLQLAQGNSSDMTLTGTFTGSGAGQVQLSSSEIAIGTAGATFNFPAGMFQWTGGFIDRLPGEGTFTNAGFMTLTGEDDTSGTFVNTGTITVTNSSLGLQLEPGDASLVNSGTLIVTSTGQVQPLVPASGGNAFITNLAGGTIQLQPGGQIGFGNIAGPLTNQGLVQVTGGSGIATIDTSAFNNTGTVQVDSGALSFTSRVGIPQISGTTLAAGTWEAQGGSSIDFATGTNLTTNQADVTLGGPGASIPAMANLATNAGTFSVLSGATFSTAGNLSNTGALTIGPASTLAVSGNYTQSAAGTLDIELGGTPASHQFGQLVVTGSAAPAGTLQAALVNGFGPSAGNSFKIITFASATGSFTTTGNPIFHGGNLFQFQSNPTNVTVTATAAVADLKVTSVSASPSSVQPGQDLTVNYSVQNAGSATSVSSWVDSVFLSSSPAINASAVLLGQVTHTGVVAAGGTYPGTLKAAVPAVAPGSYFIVVEADSQGLVADAARADTVLATTSPVPVTVPSLALAAAGATPTPATGTLATGESTAFQLQVPAGQTVQITAGFNTASAGALLVGYRAVPTQAANLEQAFVPGQSQQQVTLSNTQQGTYFVVLLGEPGAGSGAPFVLTAQEQPFGIDTFTPSSGSNAGAVTVALTGTLFTPETTVSLVAPGGTATAAIGVTFQNSTTLEAAFNLSALSAGAYHLKVQNGTQSSTATAPFTVTTGNPGQLALHLSVPSAFRPDRPVTVTVEYENTGDTDIPAPLLELSANTGELELNGQANFTTTGAESGGPNVAFLGTNPDGLASVLPPGAQGQATFTFVDTATAGTANFQIEQIISGGILAWTTLENSLRPAEIAPATWSVIFNNFLDEIGDTTDQYQLVMDEDADYFQSIGEPTQDVSRLLNFELEQAGDYGAIALRNVSGAFGLGIPDTVTNVATTDPTTGDVTIQLGGGIRQYTKLPGGTYQSGPGDTSTLTLSAGAYQIRELDGTLSQFNANGTLDFIEAPDGEKLTAGYNAQGFLATLTDSFGNVTSYSYNAQNLVSKMTSATGLVTSFTYDTQGRMATITTATGTTSFGYITDPGFADNNALEEITSPTGNNEYFVYDPLGRLIETFDDDGTDRVGYQYDLGPGEIQVGNAVGDTASYFLDDSEQIARLIDPLGNVYETQFDSNHNAIGVSLPENLTATLTRDGLGDPTQATNPLGATTSFAFNNDNEPTSITDPSGNTYSNTYDANGDLLTAAFPDGTADTYTYNTNGLLATAANRAGQTMSYVYNANGTLQSETVPGIGTYSFTYDSHQNLLTATDPTGTITYTDNSANQVTSVTYPGGQELTFTYNAQTGQRTSMTDVASGYTVKYS